MKFNFKNLFLIFIGASCSFIIIHDLYIILISPWFGSSNAGWTWFGFITFLLALYAVIKIISYFINYEEIEKKKKNKISEGQEIGYMGITGCSKGAHLHCKTNHKNKKRF